MSDDLEEAPEEPTVATAGSDETPVKSAKRRSFIGVRRELTSDELGTSGVQKMLLDDVERLEGEVEESKTYRDKFFEADKKVAVFQEKSKSHRGVEILSTSTLTVGSIVIGYVGGDWGNQPNAGFLLGLGIFLVLAGLLAKAIRL